MPMAISKSQDSGQKSLEIKNDDKFFSRLLSKETTKTNPSFRVYYGDVSGAVPFMWETRPGTPKHHTIFYDTSTIPPLTPPPSYYSTNGNKPLKPSSRSRILHTLLRRIDLKKVNQFESSSSSSSSTSSSSSVLSWSTSSHVLSPSYVHGEGRQFSRNGSSFDDNRKDVFLVMKNALLSIFRHGSR